MNKISANELMDMKGKTITTFILFNAVKKLEDMNEGDVLEITTDNYGPIEHDIKAWCRMTGHKLLELKKDDSYQKYFIEKTTLKEKERKLAFVISNPGLEELISPLGFALGAALAKIDVYFYFQGPAVRILKKNFKEKLHGVNRFFSGFARKGLANIGHIPPQEKLHQLKELGAHFYLCGPSMDHYKVKKCDLIFEEVIIAEYLTFIEIMNEADIHFFLQ